MTLRHMYFQHCVQGCLEKLRQVPICDWLLVWFFSLLVVQLSDRNHLLILADSSWILPSGTEGTLFNGMLTFQIWFWPDMEKHVWIAWPFPNNWKWHTPLWKKIEKVWYHFGHSLATKHSLGSPFWFPSTEFCKYLVLLGLVLHVQGLQSQLWHTHYHWKFWTTVLWSLCSTLKNHFQSALPFFLARPSWAVLIVQSTRFPQLCLL